MTKVGRVFGKQATLSTSKMVKKHPAPSHPVSTSQLRISPTQMHSSSDVAPDVALPYQHTSMMD
jgi:hypothetical protein